MPNISSSSSSQLKGMESLKDFGELVITIQACVIKKFLQGFMAPKQKKKKKAATEETGKVEEVDEEKKLAEEARVRTHHQFESFPALPHLLPAAELPVCLVPPWFLSGGHGSGEVEGRHQGGADLLPHARPAGNVGRLHQVGHVGRERPLQSLPQEG